jgi:hypothetical protein
LPLDFKRLKLAFEWKRRIDRANLEWVHLNFGLCIINPSFGVKYEDLLLVLPPECGAQFSVAEVLSPASGRSYSIDMAPNELASDMQLFALPGLDRLRDRASVLKRLQSESPREWPTFGASARMRLLPLMLAQSGHVNEALEWLRKHETAAASVDQLVPTFATYSAHFRTRYAP